MSSKKISQKRAEKEREDNRVLNRIYYVFLLGLAAECFLFLVYRGYSWGTVQSMLVWHKILVALTWLGLAALVGGAAVAVWKKEDRKLRTIMTWTAGAGAFFFVSGWMVTHFFTNAFGTVAMCILVAVLAVLALIYFLYQHECTLSTAMLGGAMFSVWLRGATAQSDMWRIPVIVGCVLVAAVLAAVIYLADKARKDGGKLWGLRVFSVECDYRILYAALAVAAVGVLLAAVLPMIAYYLMWALGVALFAELVYYTTKLM